MTGAHDDSHARVLQDVLCGDLDREAPELARLLAECDACRSEWAELGAAEEQVHEAGRVMRADLAAAAYVTDAPGEDRLREMVARARGASPGGGRIFTMPTWTSVAAALLLVVVVAFLARVTDESGGDPVFLGVEVECLAPVGTVDGFAGFAWRGELPAGAWFEVVVSAPDGDELLRSGHLEEPRYTPSADELARLPEAIEWEVYVKDGRGVRGHDLAESARR